MVCFLDTSCMNIHTEGKFCDDNNNGNLFIEGNISIATLDFGNNTSYYTRSYITEAVPKSDGSPTTTVTHTRGPGPYTLEHATYPVAFHIDSDGALYIYANDLTDSYFRSQIFNFIDYNGEISNYNINFEPLFRGFINNPIANPFVQKYTPTSYPAREF